MEYQSIILIIVAVGALVLLLSALRQKSERLMNFILRIVTGVILIICGNTGVAMLGMTGGVGINLVTLLTTGILGIPGVAALFAIFFSGSL